MTVLLFTPLLSACGERAARELLIARGQTMGTFYTIKVAGDFPGGQQALQMQVDALLRHCNDDISTYDPHSTLSQFNASTSTTPFPIPQDMADVVIEAVRVGHATHGLLDVTVGPLVNLWGFGPDKRPVKTPSDAQIAAARRRVGIDRLHVEVNAGSAAMRKDIPDLYVDLSTLGEGWGADRVAALLDGYGIRNYLAEVGGASRSRGRNPQGNPWRLGIQKPTDAYEAAMAVIEPDAMGVSTAGSYRNYYELDGVRYSHIIDPRTGRPIRHRLVSATVISDTALAADGWDTALMVMGTKPALAFAEQHHLAVYLITKTDAGFKVAYSSAFAPYLVQRD